MVSGEGAETEMGRKRERYLGRELRRDVGGPNRGFHGEGRLQGKQSKRFRLNDTPAATYRYASIIV